MAEVRVTSRRAGRATTPRTAQPSRLLCSNPTLGQLTAQPRIILVLKAAPHSLPTNMEETICNLSLEMV